MSKIEVLISIKRTFPVLILQLYALFPKCLFIYITETNLMYFIHTVLIVCPRFLTQSLSLSPTPPSSLLSYFPLIFVKCAANIEA